MQNNIKIFILNLLNLWTLLSACPVLGQAGQMKYITEIDYAKWGTLDIQAISDKGHWVSCVMSYENHNDTLFLLNTSKTKIFAFAKGINGRFSGERFFAFLEPQSKLKIVQLKTQKIQTFADVSKYEILFNGKYILTLNKACNQKNTITIRNETGRIIDTIPNVIEYALNSRNDALLISTSNRKLNELTILYFEGYKRINILKSNLYKYYKLAWQKGDNTITFLNETDSLKKSFILKYFSIKDKKIFSLDLKNKGNFSNLIIDPRGTLSISDDGEKVFFMEKNDFTYSISENDSPKIEVWSGNDKWLYADKQNTEVLGGIPKRAVWFPKANLYNPINENGQHTFGITGQQDYAVIYNKNPYGLQSKYYEEADFYLKNLSDNTSKLLIKRQTCDPEQIQFNTSTNKILYYHENNWQIYDPDAQIFSNITNKVSNNWDNRTEHSAPHQFAVYGCAGWSNNGKHILLYDEFDIWLAKTDGTYCKRLTRGREKNIVFRISEISLNRRSFKNFDMSEKLILEAKNIKNWSTGYYIFNFKTGEKPLVFAEKEIDQIHKSRNNIFAYKTQTYGNSPRIEIKIDNSNSTDILFNSNRQQKNYYFGKSELIYYTSKQGEKLKAALFYPANFDSSKKYPIVLHIYDTGSDEIHKYVNPSLHNSDGFNISNYSLNGYFVLLPDIVYKIGNPGISAMECVTAAVDAVIEKGFIDKNKMGLYGHSFGGYETNFIISQTPIFAAAVSGAGISDNISYYFNISKNGTFQSEMWRFESQQWRMGKSLYEDKEAYLRNSPIMNAEKVKTPLLLWTGKEDRVIPYNQSISYYLALRRLGAKSIMLIYPAEDHTLENPVNKADLSKRMMNWFDYFLKKESFSEWISTGTSSD